MWQSVWRVLAAQAGCAFLLLALVVLATALWSGPAAMATVGLARSKAAAFGSLPGILATVVIASSVLNSARAAVAQPHFGLLPVYAGFLLKLLIVAGGAFAGLVWLGLGPLYIVRGYITM